MVNNTIFERTVQSLNTKELVQLITDGDTPKQKKDEVDKELTKRKISLMNVNSYV